MFVGNSGQVKLLEFLLHDLADDFLQPIILLNGKDSQCQKCFALAGWDLLQDGPCPPLLWFIHVGTENILRLFHASP